MSFNRWDQLVIVAIVLNVVDILITLPYWQYEGNPVVVAMGPATMIVVKLAASLCLAGLWFGWDGVRTSPVSKLSVGSLSALYFAVVISNFGFLILS